MNWETGSQKLLLYTFVVKFFQVFSYIAAIFLLAFWVFFLFAGREYVRRTGVVSRITVWQWNILPFLTAVCLLLTGDIMFVVAGVVLWFLPYVLIRVFPLEPVIAAVAFPFGGTLAYGYYIGSTCKDLLALAFPYSGMIFGIGGIILIQIVCSLIQNFVTGWYDQYSLYQ